MRLHHIDHLIVTPAAMAQAVHQPEEDGQEEAVRPLGLPPPPLRSRIGSTQVSWPNLNRR